MRKLILISALCFASVSAQAGQIRGLVLAAADTPSASGTDSIPQPLPPVAQNDTKPQASTPAARSRPSRPRRQASRTESGEAKARRIAAKYGISW